MMLTFKEFLMEEKNLHMQHIEELIFLGGIEGTRRAINYLRDIRNSLKSTTPNSLNVSTKWDGCVHKDTILYTDQGDLKISDLIEQYRKGNKVKVMGRNFESISYDTFTQVIGESVSRGDKQWMEIELEDGSKIKMTEDHEVHTKNRGWIKASELSENDDITEL